MREPTTTGEGYLEFVDGLRAISILAVVAFHIGLPAPSGGFFGVDIFFVISGFLIIGQIVADCEAGRFSFGRFWARRVLRILPSYLLVILASMALCAFVLVTPGEFFDFSEQVMWSAGMAMNSWLTRHVGYFDADANVRELLHLWSLAVEEQFYILAPIAIGLFFLVTGWLRKWIPRWMPGTIAVAGLFMWSFGLAMRLAPAPNSSFFFHTEHRIWEFVAGGAVAMLLPDLRKLPRGLLMWAGVLGLAAILIGIFAFTIDDSFPSWQTAVPVFGAVLLLGAGSVATSPLTRALAWRPLGGIGLVSYAWYLWHWPLMSFAYIANFGDRSVLLRTVCAGISFLLAVLTYLLIERPMRAHRRQLSMAMPWRIVALGIAACIATMALGWVINTQIPPRIAATIPAAMTPGREGPDARCALARIGSADRCLQQRGNRPSVLLIGDSHASVAAHTFQQIAADRGHWLVTMGIDGCAPFLDSTVIGLPQRDNQDCSAQQNAALSLLSGRATGLRSAIIEAQWIFHTEGIRPDGSTIRLDDHQGFVAAMDRTLDRLRELGVERTLIVGPIPLYGIDPPSCLVRADKISVNRDVCAITRAVADAQRAVAVSWLKDAVMGRTDAMLADPIEGFCDESRCRPYKGDTVFYADFSHLGRAGEEALYAATKPGFDWLFSPE